MRGRTRTKAERVQKSVVMLFILFYWCDSKINRVYDSIKIAKIHVYDRALKELKHGFL